MSQRILHIGANSSDTNVNEKIKDEQALIYYLMMDDTENSQFSVSSKYVGKVDEVTDLIQEKNSFQIIHISGHAIKNGKIKITDKQDATKTEDLEFDTLVKLIKTAGDVKCVLLNFCYSKKAADLIAKEAPNVECVIGINGDISSTAAVDFSDAFYKSLKGKLLNDQSVIFDAFVKGQAAAFQKTQKEIYILFMNIIKKVSIYCLGHLGGSRFLDGRTREGTVGLAPSTEGFTGTIWEMNELSSTGSTTEVTLQCLGHLGGDRFLDGRTREGTVGLAPTTRETFTGTRWKMDKLSSTEKVTLMCLGHIDGNRFLNGNTLDGSVDLAKNTEGVSGTKWQITLIP
ncbi:hypothetical protein RIVM261_071600 [Rivularia sp. IAM M-261]|nr:hypothetical protein RIVM261_071600 [Rivularia sp. IAM M-261]